MVGRRGKRILISISSDDEDDDRSENSGDETEYEEEEENQLPIDNVEVEETDNSDSNYTCDEHESTDGDADDAYCGESASEDDNEEEESDCGIDDNDDGALCNRVVQFLEGKRELEKFSLKECKTYLRKNGLRISGTKATCLQRIHEHWRIKDGNGEALYPRSSFPINCTGDVCKGDIVLFTQKVYAKFDKVTRNGKLLGRRTIAGRVVKESYGAAKQQHTFTVEVLWSKGIKKLPALFPLLVKGRNLYRMRTFRQVWKNEAERSKVLEEKHIRGAAARQKMSTRKKSRAIGRGATRQKISHFARSAQTNHSKIVKPVHEYRTVSTSKQVIRAHHQNPATQQQISRSRASKSSLVDQKGSHFEGRASTIWSHNEASRNFDQLQTKFHMRTPHTGSSAFTGSPIGPIGIRRYDMNTFGSSASMMLPHETHYAATTVMPIAQHNEFNPGVFSSGSLEYEATRANQQPLMHSRRFSSFFSPGIERYSPEVIFICSTPGCRDFRSSYCVNSACWRCCRRTRIRCYVHQ